MFLVLSVVLNVCSLKIRVIILNCIFYLSFCFSGSPDIHDNENAGGDNISLVRYVKHQIFGGQRTESATDWSSFARVVSLFINDIDNYSVMINL